MEEPSPVKRYPLRMPELGLPDSHLRACIWHAAAGSHVIEGDRLLEVLAGEVTIDLPSPASGRLARRLVAEDDGIEVGQVLAEIEIPAPR